MSSKSSYFRIIPTLNAFEKKHAEITKLENDAIQKGPEMYDFILGSLPVYHIDTDKLFQLEREATSLIKNMITDITHQQRQQQIYDTKETKKAFHLVESLLLISEVNKNKHEVQIDRDKLDPHLDKLTMNYYKKL